MSPRLRLRALLAAQLFSRTGNVVTAVAVPFAVLAGGGSATDVGIAAFAATVPVLLGGPFGSVLIDRVGTVRSSAVADLVSGATLLALPVLSFTVGLPFWALLALVFASGILDAPGESARRVLIPGLAERGHMPIERAVGDFEAATRLSTLIGAPVGGVLVGALGAMPALAVTAGLFGAASVVTAVFVRSAVSQPAGIESAGFGRDLAEGLRFCVRDPLFRLVVALIVVTNLLDAARLSTLLPLYADRVLAGPQSLGWTLGAFGGAAFLGSVVFARVAHRMPRRIMFAICFVLAGGPSLVVPALGLGLGWMIPAYAVSGLAAGAINPILGAVNLERVPERLRARVFGLLAAGGWAGVPIGGLLAGVAAQGIGVTASFGVIAVAYTLVTLTPLLGGSWRLMERGSTRPAVA